MKQPIFSALIIFTLFTGIRRTTNENDRQLRYDEQHNWTRRFLWDSDYGIIQRIDRKITY